MSDKDCEEIGLLRQLAAFIDGEGNINIHKSKIETGYKYQQRLTITNTDKRLIEWAIKNFGGIMPKPKKGKKENHKDTYDWYLTGSNSYKLIKKIRPYLILKQEQADCAIELFEKVSKWNYGGNKLRPEYRKKIAEELYQKNKHLNTKGKSEEIEEVEITVKIRKEDLQRWLE